MKKSIFDIIYEKTALQSRVNPPALDLLVESFSEQSFQLGTSIFRFLSN